MIIILKDICFVLKDICFVSFFFLKSFGKICFLVFYCIFICIGNIFLYFLSQGVDFFDFINDKVKLLIIKSIYWEYIYVYVRYKSCFLLKLDLCFRGKMKRIVFQFISYSWIDFDWRLLISLRRWFCMLGVIVIVS